MAKTRLRLRFRTAQMMMMLALLVTTVAAVGVSSYVNAKLAVEDLSDQVLEQTSQRADQHITSLLQVATAQSELNLNLLTSRRINPLDRWRMLEYFYEAMKANPQLSYLSFAAHQAKEYWHVFRDRDGKLSFQTLLYDERGRKLLTDYEPTAGEPKRVFQQERPERDPTDRPYYIAARRAGHALWTETYIFFALEAQLNIPGVTRATPVYEGDQLLGVLSADFDLEAISRFLQDLRVGKNGYAFIIEQRSDGVRQVIAHPRPETLTRPVDANDPGEGEAAIAVDEFSDPRVRALAAKLPATIARDGALGRVQFTVDGVTYLGSYQHLRGDDTPAWIICMVLPERDVMGRVDRLNRITLYVGIAGVVLAVLVSILLSAQITQTLRSLAKETQQIAGFELGSKPPVSTRLVEMQQLASSLEEMKTGLRSFGKFVPAELVRDVLASGEEAKRGGERREITLYFSDIAGFTSIAEKMPAEELVMLLGEYLTAMTETIIASKGTVDKYIGDAVMAFWNAPRRVEDHSLAACRTAIANHQRLAVLRAQWTAAGRPAIRARIGLHTGEAIVGNVGSESRLDYTAIGDSVNLASRLEALNKYYATEIMISEDTYAQVRDHVVACPLDRVSVQGKSSGCMIYELVGMAGEVDAAVEQRIAAHSEGLDHYFAQRWDEAERAFERARDLDTDHKSAGLMLERIAALRVDPPASDWDGVRRMSSK